MFRSEVILSLLKDHETKDVAKIFLLEPRVKLANNKKNLEDKICPIEQVANKMFRSEVILSLLKDHETKDVAKIFLLEPRVKLANNKKNLEDKICPIDICGNDH